MPFQKSSSHKAETCCLGQLRNMGLALSFTLNLGHVCDISAVWVSSSAKRGGGLHACWDLSPLRGARTIFLPTFSGSFCPVVDSEWEELEGSEGTNPAPTLQKRSLWLSGRAPWSCVDAGVETNPPKGTSISSATTGLSALGWTALTQVSHPRGSVTEPNISSFALRAAKTTY